jgi:hypothetical protein
VAISELLTGLSEEPRSIGVTNRHEKAFPGLVSWGFAIAVIECPLLVSGRLHLCT